MSGLLQPRSGQTRDGLPISINQAPSAAARPLVARHFITVVDQPHTHCTQDNLLNENAFIRIPIRGYWEAEIAPGQWQYYDEPLLFGAQAKPLAVRVTGPMAILGFAIRPGAWPALFDIPADALADRVVPLAQVWPAQHVQAMADTARLFRKPTEAFAALDAAILQRAGDLGRAIDPIAEAFETAARRDPGLSVSQAATDSGLTPRTWQRRILATFGHTPRTVLSRSRFLDIAATMRGIALPSEEELVALRYYDQSHLNRAFRHFLGTTPGAFRRTPTPILTLGLEVRQGRKAEEDGAHIPGQPMPWRAD